MLIGFHDTVSHEFAYSLCVIHVARCKLVSIHVFALTLHVITRREKFASPLV